MAGTAGLEPATSDVTGRGSKREFRGCRSLFNSFRESQRAVSGAATVRATVLVNPSMLVLAYNECSAAKATDGPGGTYRAVYVAQLGEAVYVLHAFQKKATSGIATPQRELDLIRQRLQLARKLAAK